MRHFGVLAFSIVLCFLMSCVSIIPLNASAQPGAILLPPASDFGSDTDSDGLYDYLVIAVNYEVLEEGMYSIGVQLNDSADEMIQGVNYGWEVTPVGVHVEYLWIDGVRIWERGMNGPFSARICLYTDPANYTVPTQEFTNLTDAYAWDQFDPMPAQLLSCTHSATDYDGNGLHEFLNIDFQVLAREQKSYVVKASLVCFEPPWTYYYFIDLEESMFLDVGTWDRTITFKGSDINEAGFVGDYLIHISIYDDHMFGERRLNTIDQLLERYSYADFESGAIMSPLIDLEPTIDGVFGEGEWDDAVSIDLAVPEMENELGANMLVKNNMSYLFVCIDAYADFTQDPEDRAAIAFDTSNDEFLTDGREDQFITGGDAVNISHLVYSQGVATWIDHCSPLDPTAPGHEGLAAVTGFGESMAVLLPHRIYEFSVPLQLLGAVPGEVLGFALNGCATHGIFDFSSLTGSSWPYFTGINASLREHGDLTLGWPPISTTASPTWVVGSQGWVRSQASISLWAAGGAIGFSRSMWSLDGGAWTTYSNPITCSADGSHSLRYYSIDLGGNTETTKTLEFKIDRTRPQTTASMEGRNLTLGATDGTSGVHHIAYRIDSGTWQAYTGAVEISGDANHTVEYYSVDNAGNTEETKTLTVEKEEEKEVEDGGGGGSILGIEFFIVLAIIAIILAISIPKLFGMRRKAKESDSKAAIKDIGTAMVQMQDDTSSKKEPPPKEEKPPEKPGG